jgi:hypothetical protein
VGQEVEAIVGEARRAQRSWNELREQEEDVYEERVRMREREWMYGWVPGRVGHHRTRRSLVASRLLPVIWATDGGRRTARSTVARRMPVP